MRTELLALSLVYLLMAATSAGADDCTGLSDKIRDKMEDTAIDAMDDYAKEKWRLDGVVKPIGTYAKNMAHAKNDAERWDASVDHYLDTVGKYVPDFILDRFRTRLKSAFREFSGDDGGGSSGGCGGDGADSANQGNKGAGKRVDPLVLDLDDNHIRFIPLHKSQAFFDLTGNRFATRTAWIEPMDSFLAVDRNQDGTINDITELFGGNGADGFSELEKGDADGNGKIDSADPIFAQLRLWTDSDRDGKSQPTELRNLKEAGIRELPLARQAAPASEEDGRVTATGQFIRQDGRSGLLADVDFLTLPAFSRYLGDDTLSGPRFVARPSALRWLFREEGPINVRGYGKLPNLAAAMKEDARLAAMVKQLAHEKEAAALRAGFTAVLFRWAQAEKVAVSDLDPQPLIALEAGAGEVNFRRAGVKLSLSQLRVIQQYSGLDVLRLGDGQWSDGGRMQYTGNHYQDAWNEIYRNLLAKFAVQTGLALNDRYGLKYELESDYLRATHPSEPKTIDSLWEEMLSADETLQTRAILTQLALSEVSSAAARRLRQKILHTLSQSSTPELQGLFHHPLFSLLGDFRAGTEAAEELEGTPDSDFLVGLSGNDVIEGESGDDVLAGGPGEDRLYGGAGDDILEGGTGNDWLVGGEGADKYLFGYGAGADRIDDYSGSTSLDEVVFGTGLQPGNLSVKLYDADLEIGIVGTADCLTVRRALAAEAPYRVGKFRFADGQVLNLVGLIRAAAKVEGVREGNTLSYAVRSGSLEIVKLLLELGADVNQPDPYGVLPIQEAAGIDDGRLLEFLLQRLDLDINRTDRDGSTVLHYAVRRGQERNVRRILENKALNVRLKDKSGRTAYEVTGSEELRKILFWKAGLSQRSPLYQKVYQFFYDYGKSWVR